MLTAVLFMPVATQEFGTFTVTPKFHCLIQQYREGVLISETYHAMTEVDYGKTQIKLLLSGQSTASLNYFCCSNSSSSVDTSWTALPSEITGSGLKRAVASYTSTGSFTWNMTLTWTANATVSSKLYGVCCGNGVTTTLCLAEQQGIGSQKNLVSGDTLKMTVEGTVS